ncbi:MAG TPA: outer membrane lipoprotein-sorting protein [Prolixibacteraceae bacterium]|nr:outer membrane lipoprotein-sorting protein [Prolixibacteraceae bacterium]
MRTFILFIATLIASFLAALNVYSQDATEIVRKADTKFNGEKTNYSEMSMTIVRPKYKRSLEFKSWAETNKNALTLITDPAKEKGQTFLKSGNNMWSWNPTIQRIIKLPPAMMSQGWMGSDYSNDDILKESSLVTDYTHKFIQSENIDGNDCYVIELLPLENSDVVWGKIILWISKDEYISLKAEYYDEDLLLVKTQLAYNIKTFDGRKLPSVMEIIPADEPGNKTVVTIINMKFNMAIEKDFFSQQNMKTIR